MSGNEILIKAAIKERRQNQNGRFVFPDIDKSLVAPELV